MSVWCTHTLYVCNKLYMESRNMYEKMALSFFFICFSSFLNPRAQYVWHSQNHTLSACNVFCFPVPRLSPKG